MPGTPPLQCEPNIFTCCFERIRYTIINWQLPAYLTVKITDDIDCMTKSIILRKVQTF